MHIVAVAWIFVVVLMALAEATSAQGGVLGALITLLLYGLMPLGIVLYLMNTPARRRALRAAEQQQDAPRSASQADGAGEPAGETVAPVGKEP